MCSQSAWLQRTFSLAGARVAAVLLWQVLLRLQQCGVLQRTRVRERRLWWALSDLDMHGQWCVCFGAARAAAHAHHSSPCGAFCGWPSTTSSSLQFSKNWRDFCSFCYVLLGLSGGWRASIFQGFRVLGASKPQKFSGLAGADRQNPRVRVVDVSKSPDRRVRASGTPQPIPVVMKKSAM